MSPLKIEILNQERVWSKVGELNPSDQPGSISQNKPDGQREIYSFQCLKDGKESLIRRSILGTDIQLDEERLISTVGWEDVARLKNGQEYMLTVKTDISSNRRVIKFTHQDEK